MLEPFIILVALLCGMASRAVGFPALIGYLAAGFVLHEFSVSSGPLLTVLANTGITLLLFTIGLKLDPKSLLESKVWGSTLIHMVVTQAVVFILLIGLIALLPSIDLSMGGAAIIAFALTFSSTVFVIQTMQERGETQSKHATLAVGVLIVQDLIAVGFLAIAADKVPTWYALGALLIIPLRPLILRILSIAGYGELLTLLGLALAIGCAQLSEMVGIKGDLGALIVGAILAGHPKSKAMAANLVQLKDLFLIGFFLSIGLSGWPSTPLVIIAICLGSLACVKPLLYFPLMTRFHTSPRTAVLASSVLANHSEFGLIVISVAVAVNWVDAEWSAALSIAVAISFLVAAPITKASHEFYRKHRSKLLSFQSPTLIDSYEPTDEVRVIVLGMGRVGTGAYESLAPQWGTWLLGVESIEAKVAHHVTEQRRVVWADASDPDFWFRLTLKEVQLIMLALTNHRENMLVAELLRSIGFRGRLAAVVRHEDHLQEMHAVGISAFNLYAQAGSGFAAHASELLAADHPQASARTE